MIQAAKLASAKRITAVIPLYPLRAPRTGRPSRASRSPRASFADMLQLAGADRVPHDGTCNAGQIQGLLHDPGRPHDRRSFVLPGTSAISG